MTPDKVPSPLPVQCALDRSELRHIKQTVDKVSEQMDTLISLDGPIAMVQQRLILVEEKTDKAHERIDSVEIEVGVNEKASNSLALKVAGLASVITSGLLLAILKMLGMSNG